MFKRKSNVTESFNTIDNHIDSLMLSDREKRNLKGLLLNVKIRTGVA